MEEHTELFGIGRTDLARQELEADGKNQDPAEHGNITRVFENQYTSSYTRCLATGFAESSFGKIDKLPIFLGDMARLPLLLSTGYFPPSDSAESVPGHRHDGAALITFIRRA